MVLRLRAEEFAGTVVLVGLAAGAAVVETDGRVLVFVMDEPD